MTGGFFDFLPLIDGWDYHLYTIPFHAIVKGAPQQKLKIEKKGWVMNAALITTDAWGSTTFHVQGAGKIIHDATISPEFALQTGFVQYDPTGYLNLYNRPNPLSTAGYYVVTVLSPGYTGFPMPYRNITVETFLDPASTQNIALLLGAALVIEIKDERTFLESLNNLGILNVKKEILAALGKKD
jgi:hypothetical protein